MNYGKWTVQICLGLQNITLKMYGGPAEDELATRARCEVVRRLVTLENLKTDSVFCDQEIKPGVFITEAILINKN